MRKHVRDLAAKEANGKIEEFIITWPVNKYSAPLSVDPTVILRARLLGDVTWRDIPERRWLHLTADEQTNLKEDIWFYSRTGMREDAVRAATALANEISEERAASTQDFGVIFAFDMDAGEGPGEKEAEDWLAERVQMSLYDWVSLNRKKLQSQSRERILQFLEAIGGTVSIKQREELKLMVTPATASIIKAVEATMGEFQHKLSAVRFDLDSGDVSTGPTVVAAPCGKGTGDASTGQAVVAAPCGKNIQIHIPFGEDVAAYLEKIHKDAWRWVVCQRKMGLFKLPAGVTGDGEFADYKKRVMDNWAFPDLTPDGEAEGEEDMNESDDESEDADGNPVPPSMPALTDSTCSESDAELCQQESRDTDDDDDDGGRGNDEDGEDDGAGKTRKL